MSPYRIADELGIPSEIYVLQNDVSGIHALMLEYKDIGTYFQYFKGIDLPDSAENIPPFCVLPEIWNNADSFFISIINPEAEGIQALTIERNALLQHFVPVNEVSDIDVEGFYEALQDNQTICLELTDTVNDPD